MFNFLFIMLFFFMLFLLLNISFLTIYEQYMIGLSQNRLGPNINSFMGFFQAIFDGLKLLKKQNLLILKMNFLIWLYCFILFLLSFFFWILINFMFYFNNFFINIMGFLFLINISVFFLLLIGLFSKSKYSLIGSMRFSNQSISFEIIFFLLMFIFINSNKNFKMNFYFNFYLLILMIFLIIIFLTEMNRSPMDFSEGESELVSGFNTELSSINFTFIFMSEYNMILFFSLFISLCFNMIFMFILMIFLFIFIRCCYPRYRIDLLMKMYWIYFLLMIIFILLLYFIFMF